MANRLRVITIRKYSLYIVLHGGEGYMFRKYSLYSITWGEGYVFRKYSLYSITWGRGVRVHCSSTLLSSYKYASV